jgi:hypothetical protein
MQRRNGLQGLSAAYVPPSEDEMYSSNTAPKTGGTTSVVDSISKWLGIGQKAAETYNTIKNGSTGSGSGGYTPPPTPPPADNTAKYLKIGLIVAGAGLATFAIVKATGGGKKKKK